MSFDPGARSDWHTHPCGQTLIVTAGRGLVQAWGGPIREIVAGDVIWTPPNEKHWRGASRAEAMTHIAVQESLDGKVVEWMEKPVADIAGAAVHSIKHCGPSASRLGQRCTTRCCRTSPTRPVVRELH
ncbi:MAG: cupin domain-containing protein [Caldimonas sp.]